MNSLREYLQASVEAETALFCEAEQLYQQSLTGFSHAHDDPLLHAREPHCGSATAFIQHNLRNHYGIETERLWGEPPLAPRLEHNNRIFGHVILRHENLLIDPTYGQLFNLTGMKAAHPATQSAHYPEELALFIDVHQPEQALEPLASALTEAASHEHAKQSAYAPLRHLGRQAVADVLFDIYNPDYYTDYTVHPLDPSYDHIQNLLQRGEQLRHTTRRIA